MELYGQIRELYFMHSPKWKSKIKSFGDQHSDKTFYIARRRAPYAGLMSYVMVFAGHIENAINRGMIPIIDMQSSANPYLYKGEKGINAWELFYEQPFHISLNDVKRAKSVYFSSGKIPEQFPDLTIEHFNDLSLVYRWKEIFRRYIRMNAEMSTFAENTYNALFCRNEKVVGVLCRGTDYISLRPYNHPVQPTPEEVIKNTEELLTGGGYSKAFLATEDSTILGKFKEHFGSCLITNESIRYEFQNDMDAKLLSKVHSKIDNEGFIKGRDYLAAIYCLSKCDALIAGMTSGSLCAFLMNDNYEYLHVYDKGRYGIEQEH